MGLIGGIGEVHGLEADRVAARIDFAALACDVALETIGGVDMHGRLGGKDLHSDASATVVEAGNRLVESMLGCADQIVAQLIAVVVTAGDAELEVGCVDAVANEVWLTEVERCLGYAAQLASGLLAFVIEGDAITVYPQLLAQHIG